LRNRLVGFKAQVNLNAVDLPYAAHVTARAAVCDVHFLSTRLIRITSINPHSEATTTELAKEKRAVPIRRRRCFTSAAGEPHYDRVIQSLAVGCNYVALNSVSACVWICLCESVEAGDYDQQCRENKRTLQAPEPVSNFHCGFLSDG